MARVLLTFAGLKDPFWDDPAAGNEVEGPILSLLRAQPFDRLFVFFSPATSREASETLKAIRDRAPAIRAELVPVELTDPTSYAEILDGLRACLPDIRTEVGDGSFSIGTSSGTPQMHACWLLLAASGELPARLLHVKPGRWSGDGSVRVSEIELDPSRFPIVRPPSVVRPTLEAEAGGTLAELIDRFGIVGDHPLLRRALETAALLAASDVPVLILGESGTGKERTAELIHQMSARRRRPLEKVNCAAIPEQLAESMLFGHVKGAFTGADRDKPGAFEAADGGTLFLDEFAELPLPTQAKLLRAIDNGEIQTVGSTSSKKIDVRVVVATNKDLEEAIRERTFRPDLYHRVNVGRVELPPLRERPSDIVKLALHFLDRENERLRVAKRLSPEALVALEACPWPGNVRELHNVVRRAVLLSRGTEITPDLLGVRSGDADVSIPEPHEGFSLDAYQSSVRDRLFRRALERADGNRSAAARLLGVSPQAVSKWAKEHPDTT